MVIKYDTFLFSGMYKLTDNLLLTSIATISKELHFRIFSVALIFFWSTLVFRNNYF